MSFEYRMRVFAGPNGSGKSTLFNLIKKHCNCGYYINPDVLLVEFTDSNKINGKSYNITFNHAEFWKYAARESALMTKANSRGFEINIQVDDKQNQIVCNNPNTYEMALISGYLRDKIIESEQTFSTETVLSHTSKIDQIKKGTENGYKTYLYFVCLESPEDNKERVLIRVESGGHNVPPELIEDRYYKTLKLVKEVSSIVDRAYFFDNTVSLTFVAEMEKGVIINQTKEPLPTWFMDYVLNNNEKKEEIPYKKGSVIPVDKSKFNGLSM